MARGPTSACCASGWWSAQRDEIEFMRNWLRDRGADGAGRRRHASSDEDERRRARHADAGHAQPEELAQLDKARGPEWDRLFLTFMIRHHEGAIKMVDELFASYGALQDDDVLQVRVGHLRRPDDRDRTHAEDAGGHG